VSEAFEGGMNFFRSIFRRRKRHSAPAEISSKPMHFCDSCAYFAKESNAMLFCFSHSMFLCSNCAEQHHEEFPDCYYISVAAYQLELDGVLGPYVSSLEKQA
jgi:hypothetical protein